MLKVGKVIGFHGYVFPSTTGHSTRSTTGAMHVDVHCDRPLQAILKPVNSHSGPKLLVNELVCTELAFRLGLPCPEPIVAEISPDLGPIPLRLTPGFVASGPNYAVPFLHRSEAPPSREHVAAADNWQDLPGIVAFDAWISNRDRTTPGNLVAEHSHRDSAVCHIWMIDHGHGLTGPDWTAQSLAGNYEVAPLPYLDILEPSLRRGVHHLERWITAIEELREEAIAAVIALVPKAWLPDPAEREALTTFLYSRRLSLRRAMREVGIGVAPSGMAAFSHSSQRR